MNTDVLASSMKGRTWCWLMNQVRESVRKLQLTRLAHGLISQEGALLHQQMRTSMLLDIARTIENELKLGSSTYSRDDSV